MCNLLPVRRLVLEPLEERTLLSVGTVDPTFGLEGKVVTDFPGASSDGIFSMALQSDGKLVVAGSSANNAVIARYQTNGTLDTTFGGTGFVRAWIDRGEGVAVQSDGRIVVAGSIRGATLDMGLMRYNSDGSIDTTFGTGGLTTIDFGGDDTAFGMAMQGDGKMVVVGNKGTSSGGDIALARLNADGTLDAAFGTSGKVVTDFDSANQSGKAVAIDSAGRIVVATDKSVSTTYCLAVCRYLSNGTLDTSFGTSGLTWVQMSKSASAYGVGVQSDDRIVLVGSLWYPAPSTFALARFTTGGALDTTFGSGGTVSTTLDYNSYAYAMCVQSDNRIVAAGIAASSDGVYNRFGVARYTANGALDTTLNGTGIVIGDCNTRSGNAQAVAVRPDGRMIVGGYAQSSTTGNDVALVSWQSGGSLDATFGSGGKCATNLGGPGDDNARGVARQADGKIVMAGSNTGNFALARYTSDGRLDPTFGIGGRVTTDVAESDSAYDVAIQSDGKIVVAGQTYRLTSGYDYALVRYNSDGTLDTTFGSGGVAAFDIGGNYDDYCTSLAIQSDGKIVAVGRTQANTAAVVLLRVNANGTLDSTFGSGGIATSVIATNVYGVNDVVLDAAGRIFVGVHASFPNPYGGVRLGVACYSTEGVLDTSFGISGVGRGNTSGTTSCVAVQPDGKILVGGNTFGSTVFLVRRNPGDGSADSTFGTAGRLTITAPSGYNISITGIVVQSDGRIAMAGTIGPSSSTSGDFLFMRCSKEGILDSTIGNQGFLSADFNHLDDPCVGLVLQPDGRIVLAGTANMNATGNDFAMVRFQGDAVISPTYGDLDPTFNGNGMTSTLMPGWSARENGYAVAVQADGKVVAAGQAESTGILARYTTAGILDTTFGRGGKVVADFATIFNDLVIQPDGKVVAVGQVGGAYLVVARYNADGRLDASFGSGGKLQFGYVAGGGSVYGAEAVTLQSDGKIVVAGTASGGASLGDFGVARLTADGALDATFGSGGTVVTAVSSTEWDYSRAVAVQPDGKIVVAGETTVGGTTNMAVVRYTSAGALDATFGSGGITSATGGTGFADEVIILPDGKILVGGRYNDNTGAFALARFLANGAADTSFGTSGTGAYACYTIGATANYAYDMVVQADGKILLAGQQMTDGNTDFVIKRFLPNGPVDISMRYYSGTNNESLRGIALAGDGKIVAAGTSTTTGGDSSLAVIHLNADLSYDTGFSGDGLAVASGFPVMRSAVGAAAALQSNGKIVLAAKAGSSSDTVGTAFALSRLCADGSLDTSFGFEGYARTDFWYSGASADDVPYDVALQSDGRIVVVGSTVRPSGNVDFALARYNADGSPDATFGNGGVHNSDFGGSDEKLSAVVVQADGKIVAAGSSNYSGTSDFAIARYNSNGTADTSFYYGTGCVLIWFGSGNDDVANDLALQSDGKIVVVGSTGTSTHRTFAIARLLSTGAMDTSFGSGGMVTTDFGGTIDIAWAVAVQPDGKIVVAGETNTRYGSSDVDFALARYNADGSLDTTFGSGGLVITDFWYVADRAYDLTITSCGTIVVTGSANGGSFAVACYKPDGSPDTTFSPSGWRTCSFGGTGAATTALVQPDGRIVAAGQGGSGAAAARFLAVSPPTEITLDGTTVAENAAVGTTVGTLTSTDPDAGDTFTYALVAGTGDTDNASFTIVDSRLTTAAVFDYEAKSSYSIRVRSTDSAGSWLERSFSISVANVNETPTDVTLSWSPVPENSTTGTAVGNLGSVDPDVGDTFTYTLLDTAGGRFKIVGNQVQVDHGALLDYEAVTSHLITVRTTDAGGLSHDKSFTITVTDVNLAPTDIGLSSNRVMEHQPSGTLVGSATATDPEPPAGPFVYALAAGAGDADNASFNIDASGGLRTAARFDYATKSSYSIRVRATDSGGLWFEKALTVHVTPSNWSTFLGSSGADAGNAVAVDSAGYVYVAGSTNSASFPTTPGVYQTGLAGGYDAFVAKFTPGGTSLVWCTLLGGSGDDFAVAIATDGSGNVFVAGNVNSANFPTTGGAYDRTYHGSGDGFVAKLSADGASLVYSTFLGGTANDVIKALATDPSGNVYVTGWTTNGSTFPTTGGAYDTSYNGGYDVFVTKLDPTGSGLLYSTYLGGWSDDWATAIAVDANGCAYVTGSSWAAFPITPGAYQQSIARPQSDHDGFVAKLNANGSALVYSTWLGGSAGYDDPYAIAVDSAGCAYVTGRTCASNFPVTAGAVQATFGGYEDAFLTKLNAAGTGLAWSTLLGGSGSDQAMGIAVDSAGNAYLAGWTSSADFPTSAGDYDTSHNGGNDAYFARLTADGSLLTRSTFLGGSATDTANAIALGSCGGVFIAGATASNGFPATAGSFDPNHNGNDDAFVVRFDTGPIDLALSATSIAENRTAGTTVGTLSSTDPDSGNTFAYALVAGTGDTGNASFTIVGSQLTTAAAFDFEAKSSYSIRVRTTDLGGLYTEKAFIIGVTDQPEVFAVTASDWADTGLTLTLGGDGKLHFYRTGTTTDAVPPHDPAKVTGISVVGRGLGDVLVDNYGAAYGTLHFSQATVQAGPINATTVNVQSGQLTATSIVADTLVIGAGSSVVIAETIPPGSTASLATTTSTTQIPTNPVPVLTQSPPVAAVAMSVATVSIESTFVGPLPSTTLQPAATDAALTLASPALPIATSPSPAQQARVLPSVARPVAVSASLDHLTILLALERSAQRSLRALDTVMAEGRSFLTDSPDVFAPARPVRRRTGLSA